MRLSLPVTVRGQIITLKTNIAQFIGSIHKGSFPEFRRLAYLPNICACLCVAARRQVTLKKTSSEYQPYAGVIFFASLDLEQKVSFMDETLCNRLALEKAFVTLRWELMRTESLFLHRRG